MNNYKLAINNGDRLIKFKFKKYNSIGIEEMEAANKVIESGCLSKFLGSAGEDFLGGPYVKNFEKECKRFFGVKHVVSVNSWTSGLICAIGAIGINPGDEVIVTPWSMCATATSILHWNAIPVFADIDRKTFNLDYVSVEKNITEHTKAIVAADIFGQSCDIKNLSMIAKKYNLKLITDSAQAPASLADGKYTGTFADIGGFSLNYHKHIHTGEGGILVTNSDEYYERLTLIRNHAEAAVSNIKMKDISNMVGYNFRLGEIEAAIGISQLSKLQKIVNRRNEIGNLLIDGLRDLRGLSTPYIEKGNTHVFYILPLILDTDKLGVSRKNIKLALEAEGIEGLIEGYANIHMLPIFQEKIAYGNKGFPWTSDICKRDVSYSKGICPIAEELHEKSFLGYEMCLHELNNEEVDLIISAFNKVWDNLNELK
tara:strand:- start:3925 stop:5205 length:1281 start_codon:yes stop_codon:yes gene_type:complete